MDIPEPIQTAAKQRKNSWHNAVPNVVVNDKPRVKKSMLPLDTNDTTTRARKHKNEDGSLTFCPRCVLSFSLSVCVHCCGGCLSHSHSFTHLFKQTVTAADHHLDGMDTGGGQSPEIAGLDLYFQSSSGARFKSTVLYSPYFYVLPSLANDNNNNDDDDYSLVFESISSTLLRLYEGLGLLRVEQTFRVDLDQPNHLSPKNRRGRWMLKLVFGNVQQLVQVRQRLYDIVQKNQQDRVAWMEGPKDDSVLSSLVDLREYDVPYVVRVCTDLGIRVGAWYTVRPRGGGGGVVLSDQDVETKANPTYLAFDIECTKAPLKFPDARVDCIFMISYMVSGQGYLILSRHVVSQNVPDFEYTPQPGYPGPFHIWNEATEEDLLKRFLAEYQRHGPQIVVTYNGDFFDWPFLEQRAAVYGLDVWKELGVSRQGDEYRGRCSVHLDAFHWVQRDSYLPQGAHGLKAVTKYKLGYDPVEVDPEDMVRFARERPVHMATYSVSDAVATYYLYEKYVHLFIFSLCTIIPMGPEDVLRKGSGTLCETLLMVQACSKSIICPNKQNEPFSKFHQGHLLESETYIGGKVECLETGVFRSDVEYDFDLQPSAFQMLIDNIDRDLSFAIEVEGGLDRTKIVNYNEVGKQSQDMGAVDFWSHVVLFLCLCRFEAPLWSSWRCSGTVRNVGKSPLYTIWTWVPCIPTLF